MNCPACGKEVYDNGEERFPCPFCGAEVIAGKTAAEETVEDRIQRLERELERQKIKAKIEELAVSDHYWNKGTLFSMLDRQSAREALERGDIESAKKHLADAEKAFNLGCLFQVIALVIFILVILFWRLR